MPIPLDVKHGTELTLRRRFERWLRRSPPSPSEAAPAEQLGVDAIARTFWAPSSTDSRVAALVDAHERGGSGGVRPRGNPAFAEALFVELMRARQYRRAYEQLSEECRQRWGSPDAFAAAQLSGAMRRLQGVTVKDVRFLPEWRDPDAGRTYQEVAELKVEYKLAAERGAQVLPRVVHLVPDRGKWRSLCYPV